MIVLVVLVVEALFKFAPRFERGAAITVSCFLTTATRILALRFELLVEGGEEEGEDDDGGEGGGVVPL